MSWSAAGPRIDPGRILRLHGYKDPTRIRPVLAKTAAAIAQRSESLVIADARWRRVSIGIAGNGIVRFADGTEITCAAFDSLLDGASEAIVFVMTLGQAFDATITDLLGPQSQPLEALFLETAGRLAIEKLTRVLAADLAHHVAAEGLVLGPRLGPGYSYKPSRMGTGDRVMWPLEQQAQLFAAFGGAPLPVTLLDSSAMLPKMSRSGLFGLHRKTGD
jgi:hypothetical protein